MFIKNLIMSALLATVVIAAPPQVPKGIIAPMNTVPIAAPMGRRDIKVTNMSACTQNSASNNERIQKNSIRWATLSSLMMSIFIIFTMATGPTVPKKH